MGVAMGVALYIGYLAALLQERKIAVLCSPQLSVPPNVLVGYKDDFTAPTHEPTCEDDPTY